MHDAIVIGAGPAGSTVAKIIAETGFDVLLLEKRKPCDTKVCGGGIPRELAKKLSLPQNVLEKEILREIHYFPWGKREFLNPHVTIRRANFDRFLVDNARKHGAEVRYETEVVNVKNETSKMRVFFKNQKDDNVSSSLCKIVIFADGVGTLASKVFSGVGFKGDPNSLALGARYELEWKENDVDHYEIHYGADVSPWGYGWIFPKKNSLNVGIGCLLSKFSNLRHNITEILNRFVRNRVIYSERLKDKKILGFGAALIPLDYARKIFSRSCLVVGDAAGMVDPLHGCGIVHGVFAAELAGRVAVEALKKGDFSERTLSRYQTLWEQSSSYLQIRKRRLITRFSLPFSKIDKNLIAKIEYFYLFGRKSLNPEGLRAALHPVKL